MDELQKELARAVSENAGNRLTAELIAGLHARINNVFLKIEEQSAEKNQESKSKEG